MKKRTSLKVLLSASIILSMIPFSFLKVKAATPGATITSIYSFNRGSSKTYMYGDIYLVSGTVLLNYDLRIVVNSNFRVDSYNMPFTSGVIDCNGEYTVTRTVTTNSTSVGARSQYTYDIHISNATYLHFQVVNYGDTSYWDSHAYAPALEMGVVITEDTSYSSSSVVKDNSYYLNQILNAINNGGSGGTIADLTTIENDIDEIIELMDLNLAYDYDINTKIDILINLLQTQQGSQEQESVDNNEQINENLQTEQENYEQLEQQFNSDFDNNLDDINISDWSNRLTGWSSGVNWLKTQMNTMFNSMGDYKYMLEIGMILAIALIFIGR